MRKWTVKWTKMNPLWVAVGDTGPEHTLGPFWVWRPDFKEPRLALRYVGAVMFRVLSPVSWQVTEECVTHWLKTTWEEVFLDIPPAPDESPR